MKFFSASFDTARPFSPRVDEQRLQTKQRRTKPKNGQDTDGVADCCQKTSCCCTQLTSPLQPCLLHRSAPSAPFSASASASSCTIAMSDEQPNPQFDAGSMVFVPYEGGKHYQARVSRLIQIALQTSSTTAALEECRSLGMAADGAYQPQSRAVADARCGTPFPDHELHASCFWTRACAVCRRTASFGPNPRNVGMSAAKACR